ncbi:hypothetical protein PQR70_33700 [Paraburkholderia madseniana]|uniref:hypothetical protein n=1 Tax=Paraburkholderia madseniana TaxID=2599607 RepID=UPI0038B824D9
MTTKNESDQATIGTKELAALLNIKPQSIYKRLCETKTYWGLTPTKLPNGRLLWPADAIERMKQAQSTKKPALVFADEPLPQTSFMGGFCGNATMGGDA